MWSVSVIWRWSDTHGWPQMLTSNEYLELPYLCSAWHQVSGWWLFEGNRKLVDGRQILISARRNCNVCGRDVDDLMVIGNFIEWSPGWLVVDNQSLVCNVLGTRGTIVRGRQLTAEILGRRYIDRFGLFGLGSSREECSEVLLRRNDV